jgi:hypothetical protein
MERHLLCNQDAVTNLPTSSTAPIIAIGITAPANIAISPAIEYQAATPAMQRAVPNVIQRIHFLFYYNSTASGDSAIMSIFFRYSWSPEI